MASIPALAAEHDAIMTGLVDLEPYVNTGHVDPNELDALWVQEARINDTLAQASDRGQTEVDDALLAFARETRLRVQQTLARAQSAARPRVWAGGWVLGAAGAILGVTVLGLGIKLAQARRR